MSDETRPDVEALAGIIWQHTGETCQEPECGDGFGYHDLDTIEDRRANCRHIAGALLDSPAFADLIRRERAAALREVADAIWRESGVQWGRPDWQKWLRDRAEAEEGTR